jgi:hypothetical protein
MNWECRGLPFLSQTKTNNNKRNGLLPYVETTEDDNRLAVGFFSGIRFLFATGGGFWFSERQAGKPDSDAVVAFQYRIEASRDGETYETILDKTKNAVTKYVEFDELPPTPCRFIRLTITDWPRSGSRPLGIVECTVFGKAVEPAVMQ